MLRSQAGTNHAPVLDSYYSSWAFSLTMPQAASMIGPRIHKPSDHSHALCDTLLPHLHKRKGNRPTGAVSKERF
jgi:hypothetical protein